MTDRVGIRKVLVGYDFEPPAQIGLEHALGLAEFAGAEVTIVVAGHWDDTFEGMPVPNSSVRFEKMLGRMSAETRAEFDARRRRFPSVAMDALLVDADPRSGLSDSVAFLKADLLVTGSHVRSGLPRFLESNVAETLIRQVSCPVMIARAGFESDNGYDRILVAVDFSPESASALCFASQVLAPGGDLEAVHYWSPGSIPKLAEPPDPSAPNAPNSTWWAKREAVYAHGKSFLDHATQSNGRARFVLHEASARAGLEASLARSDRDSIVMGTRPRGGIRRLFSGSLAEVALRGAPCSVVVVHATTDVLE